MQGWIQPGWASVKGHARTMDRTGIATALLVLVHATGFLGIRYIDRETFISMTPVNLLLMQGLAWWTFRGTARIYARAFTLLCLTGLIVEWVGVHTGLLFGSYAYGAALGPKWQEVPILIGGNWFLVLGGSISCVVHLRQKYLERYLSAPGPFHKFVYTLGTPLAAALLATFFDFLMEPAAIKLGFWRWAEGSVPAYNYLSWFLVSFLVFWWGGHWLRPLATTFFRRLLIVQAVFFLLIAITR